MGMKLNWRLKGGTRHLGWSKLIAQFGVAEKGPVWAGAQRQEDTGHIWGDKFSVGQIII
jgi:hypothetical protein